MINELQNAINESLKKSREISQQNDIHDKKNTVENKSHSNKPQVNGILNGVQSEEENQEPLKNVAYLKRELKYSPLLTPVIKKRKIGPKSKVKQRNITEIVSYEPLSLIRCVLNVINKQNVPDYSSETCEKRIDYKIEPVCLHCDEVFSDLNSLARHESKKHIRINLFDRVDDEFLWKPSRENSSVRNKWFEGKEVQIKEEKESDDENDNQTLLVPFQPSNVSDVQDAIVLVNGKPEVNGISLSDLPKEERRALYKTVMMSGLKRKFCQLCRFIFKDNWAIELHYFTSACHYTCRYCGVRFNKQRQIFDEHVQEHIRLGHPISKKIFQSRKKNDPIPKIVHESLVCEESEYEAAIKPKERIVKPIKMKSLFEKTGMINNITIKKEPEFTTSNLPTDPKNQNQAYFCRKCYKVFYVLDEFNIHVTSCTGSGINTTIKVENIRSYNRVKQERSYNHFNKHIKKEDAKISARQSSSRPGYSSSGRPLRSCVKGTSYSDTFDLDVDSDSSPSYSNSPLGGYQCTLCSSVFPTVQSRNSHMRIHKANMAQLHSVSQRSHAIFKNKPTNLAKQAVKNLLKTENHLNYGNVYVKQEPLEPEVQIHESGSTRNVPPSIGNVSITPIPGSSNKTKPLNPDIMKLVQNNPNITIRSMNNTPPKTVSVNSFGRNVTQIKTEPDNPLDDGRSYRCSSCSKTFANKSDLYFHKKNQCGGSRYPCPFCKKRFGTESAYSSHIFYSHPE